MSVPPKLIHRFYPTPVHSLESFGGWKLTICFYNLYENVEGQEYQDSLEEQQGGRTYQILRVVIKS